MAFTCCLAGSTRASVPMFTSIFKEVKPGAPVTLARLNVAELGKLAPDVLVCDVDETEVDRLELLRRIRFVLPACVIAVYTSHVTRSWGLECHLAGVNCMLSKVASEHALSRGLRLAIRSGCYTDPRFAENLDGSSRPPHIAAVNENI
jgi:DNA-binding NarL/FixJ family response regulator